MHLRQLRLKIIAGSAADHHSRPYLAIQKDGTTAHLYARTLADAILSARELFPETVRVIQDGDW